MSGAESWKGPYMFRLSQASVTVLLRWAEKHKGIEVCGAVWQHPGGTQTVWPMSNVHSQPDRYYAIDAKELQGAYQSMDEAGAELVAFYHSHPGGRPDPSEADMEGALNIGVHYLIVYPDSVMTAPEVVWRISTWECIEQGILVETEYEVWG